MTGLWAEAKADLRPAPFDVSASARSNARVSLSRMFSQDPPFNSVKCGYFYSHFCKSVRTSDSEHWSDWPKAQSVLNPSFGSKSKGNVFWCLCHVLHDLSQFAQKILFIITRQVHLFISHSTLTPFVSCQPTYFLGRQNSWDFWNSWLIARNPLRTLNGVYLLTLALFWGICY